MARSRCNLLRLLPLGLGAVARSAAASDCAFHGACSSAAESHDEASLLQYSLLLDEIHSQQRGTAQTWGTSNSSFEEELSECNDGHQHALDPDMLHVAYVCDITELVGVEASLASLILHSKEPHSLTVHVMVEKRWEQNFKKSLGIPSNCIGTRSPSGTFLRVNPFDPADVKKSIPELSPLVLAKGAFRGLDSVENYARFYMQDMMPPVPIVYLDADTIVQADLGYLKKQLLEKEKTIGFIERIEPEQIGHILHSPDNCKTDVGLNYKELSQKSTYNVGVYVVDLKRWAEKDVTKRVEQLVSLQNGCDGMLWDGGSQPPLLLAFLAHPDDEKDDYMTFPAGWNYARLGYRLGLDYADLKTKEVLHWNGAHKAWLEDGYYKDLWTPYRDEAAKVIRGEA